MSHMFISPKERRNVIISWVILLIVAMVVMYFSSLSPWLDDDMFYQFNYRTEKAGYTERIHTIGDIFESQYYHYQTTNGRVVAHSIVQLFDGILGRTAFAVCNGLIYILFIRVIMIFCGAKITHCRSTLTISCLVLLCQCLRMTPAFQMYVWMYLLTLTFLLLLLKYRAPNKWMTLLLCIFSVIAGNGHESLNPEVCAGLAIYFCINRRKITPQQWLMYLCFCIGFFLIILSPATQQRMDHTCPATLEYRVLALYLLPRSLPTLFILLSVILYKVIVKKENLIKIIKKDILWWSIWITSFGILLYYGFSGGRAVLGEELAALIITLKNLKRQSFTPLWLFLLSITTIYFLFAQWRTLEKTKFYLNEIRRQATDNVNGNVYIDISYTPMFLGLDTYAGRLEYMNVVNEKLCSVYMDIFSRLYSDEWNINRKINLYPTELRPYIEHKADTSDGNKVFNLSQGMFLLVQNKRHPARFNVHFRRKIPFFEKDFPLEDYELIRIIYEDSLWRASVLSQSFYHRTYPATFHVAK